MQVATLKRRSQFQRVRGGARWSTSGFLLEARPATERQAGLRVGFTVSGKLGPAVQRNRIRRRLREAVRIQVSRYGSLPFDCVVLARPAALDLAFDQLVADMGSALAAVTQPGAANSRRRGHAERA